MKFAELAVKGIAQCLIAEHLDREKLRFHISEIAPGTRAHPPHTHTGVEAFYVIAGNGTVEIAGATYAVGTNQSIVIDPTVLHGLVNTGTTPMRYMVIIAQ